MARGDLMRQALRRVILNSEITLTVHYPNVRPAIEEDSPGVVVSPLTGPKAAKTLAEPTLVPVKEPVEDIPCLWLDAIANTLQIREVLEKSNPVGWKVGAESLARVLVEQTALDPELPYAGTIFDAAEIVVCNGKRWKIISVEPIGSSDRAPLTYGVWLKGAAKD